MPQLREFLTPPEAYPDRGGMPRGTTGLRPRQLQTIDPNYGAGIAQATRQLGQSLGSWSP